MVHARKKTTPRDLTHAAHAAPPSPCPSLVSVSLETSSTSHTHRRTRSCMRQCGTASSVQTPYASRCAPPGPSIWAGKAVLDGRGTPQSSLKAVWACSSASASSSSPPSPPPRARFRALDESLESGVLLRARAHCGCESAAVPGVRGAVGPTSWATVPAAGLASRGATRGTGRAWWWRRRSPRPPLLPRQRAPAAPPGRSRRRGPARARPQPRPPRGRRGRLHRAEPGR